MPRATSYIAMIVAVSAVAACAKAPPGSQSVMLVAIHNDLVPPSNVTIYLVPEQGIERELGTVISGRQILRYTGLRPSGNHRLVARLTNRQNIVSSTLVLDGVTALEWVLMSNFIRVTATREPGT